MQHQLQTRQHPPAVADILPIKKRCVVGCTELTVYEGKRMENATASMWGILGEHVRYRPRNLEGLHVAVIIYGVTRLAPRWEAMPPGLHR